MTDALETGTINRLHISGASFWYVCRAYLGPNSSRTRFRFRLERCSISKPESGVRATEMMTYDWSMTTACVLMCFLVVVKFKL